MENAEIFEMIAQKEEDPFFKDVWDRNDRDRDELFRKEYHLLDSKGRPLKRTEGVTSNRAKTMMAKGIWVMSSAQMRPVIEGDVSGTKASLIESFLELLGLMVDNRLIRIGLPGFWPYIKEQILFRGHVAARITLRKHEGKFIPEEKPIDARYFVYEMGEDGMEWAAPSIARSKSRILSQYPNADVKEKTGIIHDFWNDEKNVIFVDGMDVKTRPNKYGYPPFIYQPCIIGTWINDEEGYEHRGESLFAENRELFEDEHKIASIAQTLNIMSFKSPKGIKRSGGVGTLPKDAPDEIGAWTEFDSEEEVFEIPIKDVQQATMLVQQMVSQWLQQGGLSDAEMGKVDFPVSGLALTKMIDVKNQRFLPRLESLALFAQQKALMEIDQYLKGGFVEELGEKGSLKQFKAADLEGDYNIKYEFHTVYPETNIENYSLAAAADYWLPKEQILEEIIKVPDAAGTKDRKDIQDLEAQFPEFKLYNVAKGLVREDRWLEARMFAKRFVTNIKEILKGNITLPTSQTGRPQPMIPMMPTANQGTTTVPREAARKVSTQAGVE